ncbi:MAG: DUF1460 domain-containing protein [Bacteroidetes bacterium]|nr:DUF1460 domain-containing protein [Bacteroidota bacterium]
MMNRRKFLASLPAIGFSTNLRSNRFLAEDDASICTKKFEMAVSLKLQKLPIGDGVVEIGKTFVGTEYAANILEVPGEERLVVNMSGLDCVTFYENALVLARCMKKNKMTFDDYKNELQFIRYRGGVINQYPSRLHYTSDYMFDNEKKKVWKNITKDIGGVRYKKAVNFMSTHPDSYRQIRENPGFLKAIQEQEKEINSREMYHIPKHLVSGISDKLNNGDIIGITTDMEGLDTSHTGVVMRENGAAYFLHAPLAGRKVTISEKPLAGYLAGNKKQIGIMVARPLEPS